MILDLNFCYSLGYVIGWMTLIWFLAFSLISAVCVLGLSTTKCDEIKNLLDEYFNLHPDEKMFYELCQKSRGGLYLINYNCQSLIFTL
jgi:hypothetical protein